MRVNKMIVDCGWLWMVQDSSVAPTLKCGHPNYFKGNLPNISGAHCRYSSSAF